MEPKTDPEEERGVGKTPPRPSGQAQGRLTRQPDTPSTPRFLGSFQQPGTPAPSSGGPHPPLSLGDP
ncbi:hypothetical protein GCM10009663_34740 [Kitasatospora arboriphila]|uniref:Uncharacterized protein n=1 Tax=Kitasatospora arboriphila TaxID=258052 RepID=A0ABP4E235_9ACTN